MKEKDIISNIASRLAITELNAMQKRMASVKTGGNTITLLAPTGSGKTVAFAIALLKSLGPADGRVRAVVMAPSRELVLQIFNVIRPIATGLKTVAFYGGHSMQEEKNSLSVTPDIIIATPGRLLDHITRGLVDLSGVRALVLDEYDKALELGFADEMKRVCKKLTSLSLIILTSATRLDEIPPFLPVTQTSELIDFSSDSSPRHRMQIVNVPSPTRDKLDTLIDLLRSLDNGRVIVFANHRESVERIYSALRKAGLPAGIYHGGLEQNDRENAIEMLNNGSTPILVSTDLGARGLDIPELSAVIHYHLPPSPEAWTHRNGRTARQQASGEVYVITSEGENLPEYLEWDRELVPQGKSSDPIVSDTATLYFNVGKKEKISRGDIVGFLVAKGNLDAGAIGRIALRDHSALVAVPLKEAARLVDILNSHKIKNTSARITRLGR